MASFRFTQLHTASRSLHQTLRPASNLKLYRKAYSTALPISRNSGGQDSAAYISALPVASTRHKIKVLSNWNTLADQSLHARSLWNLFRNIIPSIRHTNFLTADECARLMDVIRSQKIVRCILPPACRDLDTDC